VAEVATESGHNEIVYVICLGLNNVPCILNKSISRVDGGIYLRKIGPRLFCREGRLNLAGFQAKVEQVGIYEVTGSYILLDLTTDIIHACLSFRSLAIHVPFHEQFQLDEAIPETLWDHTDRIFVRPKRYHWTTYPMVLAMRLNVTFNSYLTSLVVFCDYRERVPKLKIFTPVEYTRESAIIFQQRYREETMSWEELEIQAPRLHALNEFAVVEVGDSLYDLSVHLKQEIVGYIYRTMLRF
jgi:hypothetical protein